MMIAEEQKKGCLCFSTKKKTEFPKTFKNSNKILKKYQRNNLDISDDAILEVMIRLYVSGNKAKSFEMLQRCRINPNYENSFLRNDLEYYIPQLINYMVFHQQLLDQRMISFILKASQIDFFFAHLVYFQLMSLSQIISQNNTVTFTVVQQFLEDFCQQMTTNYKGNLLIATQLLKIYVDDLQDSVQLRKSISLSQKKSQQEQEVYQGSIRVKSWKQNEAIKVYGTQQWLTFVNEKSQYTIKQAEEIELDDFQSIFEDKKQDILDRAFQSNLNFWYDITRICDEVSKVNNKQETLHTLLQKMNENLPAAVYVPFVKNCIRNYAVLNIVYKESKVFSTKMRSPYSLTLEIFRPEVEQSIEQSQLVDKQMSVAIKANMIPSHSNSQSYMSDQGQNYQDFQKRLSVADVQKSFHNDFQNIKFNQVNTNNTNQIEGTGYFYNYRQTVNQENSYSSDKIDQKHIDSQSNSMQAFSVEKSDTQIQTQNQIEVQNLNSRVSFLQSDRGIQLTEEELVEIRKTIFGENSQTQEERIKKESPFQTLKSWKLVHLIVKSGDNLKQEQFALQLICQFDQIFKKEGLPLKLRYYEVLSLGPDCGVMEMIKNATTIDSLQKHLQRKYKQFNNFSDFFRSFFRNNIEEALQNYVQSLAAYGLVCYFLQVKDRHNANILLDDQGNLIHIDFGFFLSIAPGKGMEFEGKVPFKLLSDYIQVLGGAKGTLFQDHFRRLFYRGFKACQKHQKEILLLVEMMYTGHGTTLPCFQKGEIALKELEKRFNPRVASDAELFVFVQNLINKSLDNWRARWYDKFQYFAQGIFY